MIVKNQEAVTKMAVRLQSILDTDEHLSQYERDCISEAITAIQYIILDDEKKAYTSRLADHTD